MFWSVAANITAVRATQHVTVDCTWTDHDPFVPHDIILSADVDGDGGFEPLATCQLSETSQTPVAIGDGPGRTPLPGLAVSPAPFRDQMTVRFTLDAPSAVRVEVWDVSGRLVRTLHSGAMTRGTQSVTWDGRLANGRAATSGLYLVRVQAGSRVLTAKVLRAP